MTIQIADIDDFRTHGLVVAQWATANRQAYADAIASVGHIDNDTILPWDNAQAWVNDVTNNHGWACIEGIVRAYVASGWEPTPTVIVESPTREVLLEREVEDLKARIRELNSREYRQYEPSMEPMFRNAARIAQNAGYCSEYDRIAEAVGAPTRDELFIRHYEHTVGVTLTYTVTITDVEDPDWDDETVKSYIDVNYPDNVSWEIIDSEEGSLIDPDTGESID